MQSLVRYYHEVLGIREVLIPQQSAAPSPDKHLLLVLSEDAGFTPVDEQYFAKVLNSIQVQLNEVQIIFRGSTDLGLVVAQIRSFSELGNVIFICLSHELFELVKSTQSESSVYYLPHPSLLQNDQGLKRSAWETLKQIKLEIQPSLRS